eukprot:CAMPEP_0195047370 /NCGR_PEP_ID=MMETSP0347-20130606/35798_1 /TAXON_ID=2932 /ORGANISM="Alexandrium fundyense, Strain CCMP1719" /LENGTH=51 /DNA_ID=CAMNT_0040075597 /DNA_START=9 /DNA_END=161 /DNA_ORIENTATION=+
MDAETNYLVGMAFLGKMDVDARRAQWAAHYLNLSAQGSNVQAQYRIGRLFL